MNEITYTSSNIRAKLTEALTHAEIQKVVIVKRNKRFILVAEDVIKAARAKSYGSNVDGNYRATKESTMGLPPVDELIYTNEGNQA